MQTDLLLNFLFTEDMAKKMKTMIDWPNNPLDAKFTNHKKVLLFGN